MTIQHSSFETHQTITDQLPRLAGRGGRASQRAACVSGITDIEKH